MIIKNKSDLKNLEIAGQRLHIVLQTTKNFIQIGTMTADVEKKARELIYGFDDTPSFLNYTPRGATRAYPAAMCVSINDEIVHGIPNEREYRFKSGDIVTLDCGLTHNSFIVDSAITFVVGECDDKYKKMIQICDEALYKAINFARPGTKTKNIGALIEEHITKAGYSVPMELGGHGVGKKVHEEPFIPNVERMGTNEKLQDNQVIAIEPIAIYGNNSNIFLDSDGYTYKSTNEAIAVHCEHTVLVKKGGAFILT